MINDLYNGKILELAASLPPIRRLDAPDATAHRRSRLCGSEITVELKLDGGQVADFGLEAKACALGQTSAAVMSREIIGATPSELRAVRDQMRDMLKHDGPPPSGKWADLALLQPVKDYAPRHTSTLLVFDAVVDALDDVEARTPAELA